MFAGLRSYAQGLANAAMDEPITIRHKKPFEKDPDNPYGDDTLTFEDETTEVLGWAVSSLTKSIDTSGALTAVAETDTLRLPVGTRIDTGDEVIIKGETWTVADTSSDETYPAMLKVSIQRQG